MHLADLIRGLNRRLKQALEAHLKPGGFSLHQYRVLEALDAQNGLPMGYLATHLLIDGPTLTKIIDKMVASAEVYRGPDPHDRRKVLIFLSRKGADGLRDIRWLRNFDSRGSCEQVGSSQSRHFDKPAVGTACRPRPLKSRRGHFSPSPNRFDQFSHCTVIWIRRAGCVYRKPKPGRSDDEVRPRLGDKECVRRDRRRARPVHLSPGIDACGSHCNISCNRAAGDEGGAR